MLMLFIAWFCKSCEIFRNEELLLTHESEGYLPWCIRTNPLWLGLENTLDRLLRQNCKTYRSHCRWIG